MALLKPITLSNGVVTTYHKVMRVTLIDENGSEELEQKAPLRFEIVTNSYVSAKYRETGKSVNVRIDRFEITSEEEDSMGIRKLAYSKLKTLPDFAEAEDC